MKVGFLVVDNSKLSREAGADAGPDPQQGFRDIVRHVNAHGGLEGRPIRPEYYTIDGRTADAPTHAARACAFFAQDKKVQVVVGKEWTHPGLESCLGAARIPHFDAGMAFNLDAGSQAEFPFYFNATTIGGDRYESQRLPLAVKRGWIKSGEVLGVFVADCTPYTRVYEKIVVPTAKRLGMRTVPQRFKCPEGAKDLADLTAAFKSAVLRFRSEGVTTVMAVTTAESVIWAFFAQEAENQGYKPTYLLTSDGMPYGMTTTASHLAFPEGQVEKVRGFGWKPLVDVGPKAPPVDPAQRAHRDACLKMSPTAGGATEGTSATKPELLSWYFDMCDTVLLLGKLIAATGGSTALPDLNSAYRGVAGSFVSATDLSGRFNPAAGRHDGGSAIAPFSFDKGCSCTRYVGPPVRVP